ncbi:hypothetical protein [Natronococcus jeotgali]|uniref:Uncharacterized protein n=1 Tax=Natronococcus jeotgali DSM 18795 TaxID=1227498 RepID=L9XWA9_9EURY|nr:hypothetical protein [Natronococcus jeotgali]ELY66025.1 hypothetical protein C492_02437 [Natronococcus jeotgali DSM 18795]
MANRRQESDRVAAICENCETVHAAHVDSGGEINPIGSGACQCGDGALRIIEASPEGFEDADD